MTDEGNPYIVPGLERGLRLLQLFDRQVHRLTPPEIARRLDIPRSAVFRLLQTLEHFGFLERDGNAFGLGPGVLRLGFEYLASLEITELARPIVEGLRDTSGYAAQMVVRDGREVVVVLRATAPFNFASTLQVGTRLPVHATILGRVLLADLDDAAIAALYPEARLPAAGRDAPATAAELARRVRADAARGYAVSESAFESGICAVAAPVRDDRDRMVAAVNVTVPAAKLDPVLRARLIEQVVEAAGRVSYRLNHRGASAARA